MTRSMELSCSWNRIEAPAGGDEADPAACVPLFQRPPTGTPCELLLPVQQPVRGVRVVSNARVCEVYVQSPNEPAPSYVCSLRGECESTVNSTAVTVAEAPSFAIVFQTEGSLQVSSTLVLRLLSLSPFKDELRLHGIEWLAIPEPRVKIENGMENAPGSCSSHSGDLLTEVNIQAEQTEQQQQQRQAERGGSQMAEIRSMLQSVALEGGGGGSNADPKRSLMVALARSALSQPGSQEAAAPQVFGAAASLPPWAAAFMQSAFASGQPNQQQHQAAAAQTAGTAQLPAVSFSAAEPSLAPLHNLGGSTAGGSSSSSEAVAAGVASAPVQVAGYDLPQLECMLARRLEASLGQLEARLLRALHQAGSLSPGAATGGSQLGPAGAAAPQLGGSAEAAPSPQGGELAAAAAGGLSVAAEGVASTAANSSSPVEGKAEGNSGSGSSGSGNGGHGAVALPVALLQRLDLLEGRMARLERQGDELRSLLLQLLGSGSSSTAQP